MPNTLKSPFPIPLNYSTLGDMLIKLIIMKYSINYEASIMPIIVTQPDCYPC